MTADRNSKTLIIMGKSGSGKDSTGKLLEEAGFARITTHTSRPMRAGEQEGISYYFHTQEEFETLRDKGYFAESRDYDAAFGHCSYGTSKDSLILDGLKYIILTPEGYQSLTASGITGLTPVYLRASDSTLKERLSVRLKDEADPAVRRTLTEEIDRRLDTDRRDFMELDAAVAGLCSGFDGLITIDVDHLTRAEVADTVISEVYQPEKDRDKTCTVRDNGYEI